MSPISTELTSSILDSDKRYELLVNSISDYAIYLLDLEGNVVSWNSGAIRFKGYSREEIIGQHFSRFFTPEDLNKRLPWTILAQAFKNGRFESEGWRVRKDGSQFWASIVVDAIKDENNEVIGYAKVTRDITERKKAQDDLFASEERFRLLVQGVTDYAIYMLTPEGIVSNWNLGAEKIKGYAAEEIIGQHFRRFFTKEDVTSGMPERALNTAKMEGRFEQEGWRVRKDGSKFRAHAILDAIHNDKNELVGFAKITRDITERFAAEEAISKANEALFRSQKMEALGKLTGGIAHDFNNLLSVVSTGLEVFSLSPLDARQVKMVESMKRAVTRGATLTQQLLSFARQQPLKSELHNVNQLITSFEPLLLQAGSSNIRIQTDLAQESPYVHIDVSGFESALLNLIVNARDSLPEGGYIKLKTEVVHLVESEIGVLVKGRYVKISVEDNGTGISPDVIPRILEPFFTTKEIGKGTGLGLSQVYGFILQSNGDIGIESQVGVGTQISIYLPLLTSPGKVNLVPLQDVPIALIVDDEPDILLVASELFKSMGYHVLSASSGEKALEILKEQEGISVLFTDVLMTNGINGIELAKKVRLFDSNIKIILASGYALPALQDEHQNIDRFNFLTKPYRLADIAQCLRSVDLPISQ